MNTHSHPRPLAWFVLAAIFLGVPVHAAGAVIGRPPVDLVGDFGRREALVMEGNQTFTQDEILHALRLQFSFYVAGHSTSPRADYVRWLVRRIADGYRHSGFPDVVVEATLDENAGHIRVNIKEGMRFRCGDVVLSGEPSLTNAAVKQKILDKLGGLEPRPATEVNPAPVVWKKDGPAAFDENAQQQFDALIAQALQELDCYRADMKITQKLNPASGLVDLRVEFRNAGIKGVIDDIEVLGLRTNTPGQIWKFLNLERGMEMRASLLTSIPEQLKNTGRFIHHEAKLEPGSKVGGFKLVLDLEEVLETPPLDQELSPESIVMLKFHRWLRDWEKRPEDFVCSLSITTAVAQLEADVLLNTSGLAFAFRTDRTNQNPELKYAFVAASELVGAYSAWRQSKYVFKPGASLTAFVNIAPNTQRSMGKYNVTLGGNIQGQWAGSRPVQPFRLIIDLHPSVFVVEEKKEKANYVLTNGVLTFTQVNVEEKTKLRMRIDAETGRLIEGTAEMEEGVFRVRSEETKFARVLKEIALATADYPNEYVTNGGFSSALQYFIADVLKSRITDNLVKMFEEDHPGKTFAQNVPLNSALQLAREVISRQALKKMFEPMNRIGADTQEEKSDDPFAIPLESSAQAAAVNPMVAMFGAIFLMHSDELLARDSWPWALVREFIFRSVGEARCARAEMERLIVADNIGPLGCLLSARSVGKTDPKLARAFAERGRSRLSPAEFHKDYAVLMQSNSVASEVFGNALALLNTLNEEQIKAFAGRLPAAEAAFFREVVRLVRSDGNAPASNAWPAFERHWDSAARPKLETALNHFLPQVHFLTNSEALYARGIALVADDAVLKDFVEAMQCFRKAAEQGHAGAQLRLGSLYELDRPGFTPDLAEAMRWYRSAAQKKELHASCRIGDLYRDGRGMDQDLEEAARWYRIDSERGCAGAQFNLGRFSEKQNKMADALHWFRLAATNRHAAAESQLGDLLSDGLFVTPDFVEAAQWLTLAAREGDKLAEIRLRRVRTKMSADQQAEAQDRVTAFLKLREAEEEKLKLKPAAQKK